MASCDYKKMEVKIGKKIASSISSSPNYENDSSSDSNYESYRDETYEHISDEDYLPQSKGKQIPTKRLQSEGKVLRKMSTSSMDEICHIRRKPTRKPNPNIYNRNALMARENRRRKKEYMENMEQNMEKVKIENKKLKKLLKQKDCLVGKLKNEGLYLRSIIANKSEIFSLLKTIQGNQLPLTSSTLSFVTDQEQQENTTNYSYSSGSPKTEISNDLLDIPCSSSDTHDDELDLDNWENILDYNTQFKQNNYIPCLSNEYEDDILSNVNNEHNYFNNNTIAQKESEPGICLHLSSGRISLEFCATCHMNSQNAWDEEM